MVFNIKINELFINNNLMPRLSISSQNYFILNRI